MENIWKRTSPTTQKIILETTAFNTVLYGCETWIYNKMIRDKLLAFEMYCYWRILCISLTKWKTNREICDKLRIEKDLLQRGRPCTDWIDDIVSWCKSEQFGQRSQFAEDGNSLQDKQWTTMGAGPMVPEEEEEANTKNMHNTCAEINKWMKGTLNLLTHLLRPQSLHGLGRVVKKRDSFHVHKVPTVSKL